MPSANDSFAFYAVTDAGAERLKLPAGAGSAQDVYGALSLGVYSSLRTFEHYKFLDLEGHIERTLRSMRAHTPDFALDEHRLRHALDAACRSFSAPELRVRFDLLAEPASALGSDSIELICLQPFSPPPAALYRKGVRVRIARGLGRSNPKVKDAAFVKAREAHLAGASATPDVYEWLLEDEAGRLLEGMSSNFYAVGGGMLRTAGDGVLEGITRRIVLDQAAMAGVRIDLAPVATADIPSLQEAAISSSSRGLMPVTAIDEAPIGNGRPGPVIARLVRAYEEYVHGAVRPAI